MLKGLLEFITVVEQGNFTLAAEQLGTTRARVSQVIAELEQELAVQLIVRSTRSMQLTASGERFYQNCRNGWSILQDSIEQVKSSQTQLSGLIRINSVGGWFGERILAPLLIQFMHKYPQVKIELDFASSHVDLIADRYDLAVRMGDLPDSNLIARPLTFYPSYVCASTDYIKNYPVVEHPKQLKTYPCILGSMKKWQFSQNSQATTQSYDFQPTGTLQCANGYVAYQAAMAGVAMVRLPSYYVAQDIQAGRLVNMVEGWNAKGSQVSLVCAKAKFKPARIECLIDYLCAELTEDSGSRFA